MYLDPLDPRERIAIDNYDAAVRAVEEYSAGLCRGEEASQEMCDRVDAAGEYTCRNCERSRWARVAPPVQPAKES